jgi:hypothetical protein
MNPTMLSIVEQDVRDEIKRQDEKWGEQNHPDGTGAPMDAGLANLCRNDVDRATEAGELTWRLIATEEFAEALAETDERALRTELIQCAAVFMQWAAAIDRR